MTPEVSLVSPCPICSNSRRIAREAKELTDLQ